MDFGWHETRIASRDELIFREFPSVLQSDQVIASAMPGVIAVRYESQLTDTAELVNLLGSISREHGARPNFPIGPGDPRLRRARADWIRGFLGFTIHLQGQLVLGEPSRASHNRRATGSVHLLRRCRYRWQGPRRPTFRTDRGRCVCQH